MGPVNSPNCPLDYATEETAKMVYLVRLYGVEGNNVKELLDTAYTFSVRYEGPVSIEFDADENVSHVVVSSAQDESVTEDYVYDQFRQYVKDTCGSLYSEVPCAAAWNLMPKITMESFWDEQSPAPTPAPDPSSSTSIQNLLLLPIAILYVF